MAEESTQKWLGRNRPPRVQITYDLETRGAIEKKELPLVVGIMADLFGETDQKMPDLKTAKFIEIDRDNFNDVMRSVNPTLTVKAFGKAEQIAFHSIDDFTPDALVKNVKALNELLTVRQHLNDILARVDGNDVLGDTMLKVAQDSATRDSLKKLLPAAAPQQPAQPAAGDGGAASGDAAASAGKKDKGGKKADEGGS